MEEGLLEAAGPHHRAKETALFLRQSLQPDLVMQSVVPATTEAEVKGLQIHMGHRDQPEQMNRQTVIRKKNVKGEWGADPRDRTPI